MTTININVSQARLDLLDVGDMIAVEEIGEGKITAKALRSILSKFVADDKGEYLSEEEAVKLISKIKRPQFVEVVRDFFQKVTDMALNPTTDGS
jgi:hypothetical protein